MIALAFKSLKARRLTVGLTLLALAISTVLLLGVQRMQAETKQSFLRTVSGTDMIVGSRTSSLNLLLYSVFRIGQPTNVVSWQSYQEMSQRPEVAWNIPFSLGDSHRGFRVLGTTDDYFKFYRYADERTLSLKEGQFFRQPFDVVLGAQVAKKLGYDLGQSLIIAHGTGSVSFTKHDNLPFKVVGILQPTGTPIDKTVHVPLEGISAIHMGWNTGKPQYLTPDDVFDYDLTPKDITGFFVGLNSPITAFSYQRAVQTFHKEPLSAVLPGVALQELWSIMDIAERVLTWVAGCVFFAGFLGLITTQLASLNERRREMAILRSIGAPPSHLFFLLLIEAVLMIGAGLVFGVVLLYGVLIIIAPYVSSAYGFILEYKALSMDEWVLLACIYAVGVLIGLLPALRAYFYSLTDGMQMRV